MIYICCTISLLVLSRLPPGSTRTNVAGHHLRTFRLQLLQCLLLLVFHDSPLLEICDLQHSVSFQTPTLRKATNAARKNMLSFMDPTNRRQGLTQLLAQLPSKPLPSTEHAFSALSFSAILSTILFRSRHLKYVSLASQHLARWLRSGAIGAPSDEILGGGGEAGDVLKNPIVRKCV
jgi:hypothetical protein